jgi:transglutaminase-like putative cysteine protease
MEDSRSFDGRKALMDDAERSMERYLQPTAVLDYDSESVKRFVEDAIRGATDPRERAVRLFYEVRDGIAYDALVPFHRAEYYRAGETLKRGRGYCVQKAALLIAGLRRSGIPARFGFANLRNHGAGKELVEMMGCNIFSYHGFAELHLGGKWIKATPSFDPSVCEKHDIDPLTFDGEHDAVFPSKDRSGRPYVEYLDYLGSYADLPLDDLLEGWNRTYGEDRVASWIASLEAGGLS